MKGYLGKYSESLCLHQDTIYETVRKDGDVLSYVHAYMLVVENMVSGQKDGEGQKDDVVFC